MKLMLLPATQLGPRCPTSLPFAQGGVWAGAADWVLTSGWTGYWFAASHEQNLSAWDGAAWATDIEPSISSAMSRAAPFAVYSPNAAHQWALTEQYILFNSGSGWGVDASASDEAFVDLLGCSTTELYALSFDLFTAHPRLWTGSGSGWDGGADLGAMLGTPVRLGGVPGGPLWATFQRNVTTGEDYPGYIARVDSGPTIVWTGATSGSTARTAQQPFDVWALSSTNVWFCGARWDVFNTQYRDGFVGHYDGSTWATITAPVPASGRTYVWEAISATSSSDVWVAGYEDHIPPTPGDLHVPLALRAARWNGSAWTVFTLPGGYSLGESRGGQTWVADGGLHAIHARTSSDVWAVGTTCTVDDPGTVRSYVAHWDGTAWAEVPIPES